MKRRQAGLLAVLVIGLAGAAQYNAEAGKQLEAAIHKEVALQKESAPREAVAAGIRPRTSPRVAPSDVRIAGLAREIKERIAARGKR